MKIAKVLSLDSIADRGTSKLEALTTQDSSFSLQKYIDDEQKANERIRDGSKLTKNFIDR